MTRPVISVLKRAPQPMGVAPVRGGVLQGRLAAQQAQERVALVQHDPPDRTKPVEEPAPEMDGIMVPEEPTLAMIAAGLEELSHWMTGVEQQDAVLALKVAYHNMLRARFDPDPVDTQSLFGASKSEIEAALILYRKMKAPKKRKT